MKLLSIKTLGLTCVLWGLSLPGAESLAAVETNRPPERIGVYDSRIVAYACFLSPAHRSALEAKITAARQAKAAGDTEKLKTLSAELRKEQTQAHLQVFGSAPADDALAQIKDRLGAVQQKVGASCLVCKWDEATLKLHPQAERVDVTDALVREFIQPDEKQQKAIDQLKRSQPVPAEELMKEEQQEQKAPSSHAR